ncbi:ATP-dependent zinc metalloprotease FtsH [Patescibacteria group bacterium]|nr:ATP-dependent zinc metalloprotease FtsH [Patescibacteria group bacterium]
MATSKKTSKKKSPPKKGKPKKVVVEIKRPTLFSNIFFYIFLLFVIYILSNTFGGYSLTGEEVSISDVVTLINEEKVQDITVAEDKIEVLLRDGTNIYAEKETSISFDEILTNNNIDRTKIEGELQIEHRVNFEDIVTPILMFGFPIFILYILFKQMKGQNSEIMSFGKSKAKVFFKGQQKITFKDVAGCEEAKRDMLEIVDFLKYPTKYRKLGARIPKGVLLVGPSGVGKTLLARAISGEAGVPFFSVGGSEFMEMLVGVGSSRARDLFKMAREHQPSLIFIDEIDAIGRQRGMGIGGGHDEREQTLNQILIEMDGFDLRTDVIVIGATNRPDMLDPALIRPGRFDRRISIPLPDLTDRVGIIKIHMQGKPFEDNVNVEGLAKKTVGFSGADIENMLNESAILTARDDRHKISNMDLDEASLKVTLGSERRTLRTEEEREVTAYHEAGHALVAAFVKDMDPVQRISIVARGATLGHTEASPERDRYNETETRLLSKISVLLGGRAAEDVVFKELSVGAANDIKEATRIARMMVTDFGMSGLGPIHYDSKSEYSWLAQEFGNPQLSDEMSARIDNEIKKIIDDCFKEAKDIIIRERTKLDKVSKKLLEIETMDGDTFRELIK